jgi:predicted enzyme related to lactoylglutathione lyase
MINGIESVTFYSEDAKRLADFYKEKVGLKVTLEAEMGEGQEVYEFSLGDSLFRVIDHPKIKGQTQEPERVQVYFEVDDIEKEEERLVGAGVKKIEDIHHIEGYGYVATFEDADGNYFQVVQVRAN